MLEGLASLFVVTPQQQSYYALSENTTFWAAGAEGMGPIAGRMATVWETLRYSRSPSENDDLRHARAGCNLCYQDFSVLPFLFAR